MKGLFIIFLFCVTSKTTQSQSVDIPNKNGMIDNIKTVQPLSLIVNFPQATYLFKTDKGAVYALPMDNMPCLVPDAKSNMPVVGFDMNRFNKIPNAFPEFKIIPNTEVPKTNPLPPSDK